MIPGWQFPFIALTLATFLAGQLLAGDLPSRERVSAPLSKIDDAKYEWAFKLTVEPCFRSPVVVELLLPKTGTGIVRVFRTWGKAG